MLNFDFYNPTHIIFGKDRLGDMDAYVPADATVLITYGGGISKKSGLIDRVRIALGSRKVFEFGGIDANPHYETLMKALEMVCRSNIDYILAVGGGSVIDGTKFIALASHYPGDSRDLLK
jgi:NADP-dependent alcohol dehydrogenase